MSQKYTQIREALESVRAVLDHRLRSDRQITYMLDQIIEVATHVELQRKNNIIELPSSPSTKLFVFDPPPR